jgi:glycosyltransferase involved in cell wall biosynthesis
VSASKPDPSLPGSSPKPLQICVLGAGPRFLSGISYYTNRLINALGTRHRVSAILIGQLLPTRFYPGRDRVGADLVEFEYPPGAEVFDGVNWWWGRSIWRAVGLLVRRRPQIVLVQWWTGTVLHSYLLLVAVAKLLGAKVVIEFHEVLDTGELGIAAARWYVKAFSPLLIRMADGVVVHSEYDRAILADTYDLTTKPTVTIPHGPYDQYTGAEAAAGATPEDDQTVEDGVCRLLYFGVIRPFKGVEDLLAAFELLDDEQMRGFHLTVVGETWEGWTRPAEMIAASKRRDRIELVNHYVRDDEVAALFESADAVVLPYHRSSASGPLHLAMAHGLPVLVTEVGGLVEATRDYQGAVRVPPHDPEAIRAGLLELAAMRGRRFSDVHTWERTVQSLDDLFGSLASR